MNKLKKNSLILISLFVILSASVFGQSLNSSRLIFKNNGQDQLISAILSDEVDDSLDTEQVSSIHQLHFVQLAVPLLNLRNQSLISHNPPFFSQIPFYLKIRNLRI